MTVTADFVAYPKAFSTASGAVSIRLYDKSVSDGGPVTAWSWTSSVGSFNSSTVQNPILTVPQSTNADLNISLVATESDGATHGHETKNSYLVARSAAVSAPTPSTDFGRVSIFLYNDTYATIVNRLPSTNNNLFFKDLNITGQLNRASLATFEVYDIGATAATGIETSLLAVNTNIAVIIGKSVVFSGKIIKCVQGTTALFSSDLLKQSWKIDCHSDIVKMKGQSPLTANQATYTGPVGYIVSKIVEGTLPAVNWLGTYNKGTITYEGPDITYKVTEGDMYSQFETIANTSGFDWRTRNAYSRYQYTSFTGLQLTVSSTSPYPTNGHVGKWAIFLRDNYELSGFGKVSANTTTVISLTNLINQSLQPASGWLIVLGDPVLDFTNDLRQVTPVSTFYANQSSTTTRSCYGFNDRSDLKNVATKVVVKGKQNDPKIVTNTTPATTIVMSMSAANAWDDEYMRFENTEYMTKKTEGYVLTANGSILVIDGVGYSLKADDYIFIVWKYSDNPTDVQLRQINTILEHPDGVNDTYAGVYNVAVGTVCTGITVKAYDGTYLGSAVPNPCTTDSYIIGQKVYVKDYHTLTSTSCYAYVGTEPSTRHFTGVGTDADYGDYLSIPGTIAKFYTTDHGFEEDDAFPHFAGIPITKDTYTESSPQTGSPINYFGIITKTLTPDSGVSKQQFEIYAINALINLSYFYRIGSMNAVSYDFYKPDVWQLEYYPTAGWIQEGDRITVLQYNTDSATDTQYGQYKNQWQVVSWRMNSDDMTVEVTLGDYERNLFVLMNDRTAGLNEPIT